MNSDNAADNRVLVSFADLTHTGRTIDANYFPLGCAFVAAYAKDKLGDRIRLDIFKYPEDFSAFLGRELPQIACFSNYSWAINLSYEYAARIKKVSPSTIIIFGGPNYPSARHEQIAFLESYPLIDFYIDGDGEEPLALLLEQLIATGLDPAAIKNARQVITGVHYLAGGEFVHGMPAARFKDLDVIPSPYLTGLLDKFFDDRLGPLMQTHRGCPYSCAYCHDGIDYMDKLGRVSHQRAIDEIDYIFARHKTMNLLFADDNFGIYPGDVDIARYLANMQKESGWPAAFNASSAKNNKARLSEIAQILGRSYTVVASVQSTDPEVLKQIKRTNVPWDQMIELVHQVGRHGAVKLSEVILCLPKDTREKHFKSVTDLIDLGMDEIRMYQMIMLPGTDVSSDAFRQEFGYETRFRVMPRCIGYYDVFEERVPVYEFHEICVGHATLPHADYKACRRFNLLIEIFNNGAVFTELLSFINQIGILRSRLILDLYDSMESCEALGIVIRQFEADEESNFWNSEAEMKAYLATPGVFERYMDGELGGNQMLRSRMMAHLQFFAEITDFIFARAVRLVEESGLATPERRQYLDQLKRFVSLRKGDLLSLETVARETFHFDFLALADGKFQDDPLEHALPGGQTLEFRHSDTQRAEVESYLTQFGFHAEGLGHMAQRGIPVWNLYKTPRAA